MTLKDFLHDFGAYYEVRLSGGLSGSGSSVLYAGKGEDVPDDLLEYSVIGINPFLKDYLKGTCGLVISIEN